MKNSTRVEIQSIPSSENYLDQDFLKQLHKGSKRSTRWIVCTSCGKTITKPSMAKHQISCHGFQKISMKG